AGRPQPGGAEPGHCGARAGGPPVSVVAPNSSRFAALQYKPGSTFLHLLDARTKLLATAIAIAGVLITPQPVGYLALLVLLACATAAARVGPALFWRAFGLLLIMVVISGVITVIIWPGPDRKSTRLNSSHRTISY